MASGRVDEVDDNRTPEPKAANPRGDTSRVHGSSGCLVASLVVFNPTNLVSIMVVVSIVAMRSSLDLVSRGDCIRHRGSVEGELPEFSGAVPGRHGDAMSRYEEFSAIRRDI